MEPLEILVHSVEDHGGTLLSMSFPVTLLACCHATFPISSEHALRLYFYASLQLLVEMVAHISV